MKTSGSWLSPKVEIRKSRIDRNGVFAKQSLSKGERVAIFGGDIMAIDEIDNLPLPLQDGPFQIEERFVLGRRNANRREDADFFNHSCNPNCGFRGQIFLVAIRSIKKDEEITFDYAMVVSKSVGSQILFKMECNCAESRCRLMITENDWKLRELQKKYRGFFSQYLEEKIAGQKITVSKVKGPRKY